jgi:tetratricopeptide (TPR) repeat protein
MKATHLLSLLVLSSPLMVSTPLMAQDSPAAAEDKPAAQRELTENQKAFLNLPEESRKEFGKHIGEASRLFQQKRIFETLDELDKAAKIFQDSPELHNLRGSCYVEMRAFDKALAEFTLASEFAKGNPSLEFNIGEVYFCTQEWQKALDIFEKILTTLPKENTALGRLIEFKILLCQKKLGMDEEVAKNVEKYTFEDDSPYYYYAQAAIAYEDKDLAKAEEWLAMAGRIFRDPAILAPWQDTLVEYGYIKSFYGDADAAEN